MELLHKYFPGLSDQQILQFDLLSKNLAEWNEKINVISRKDIKYLEERHILHSLSILKFVHFKPGTNIIDVGTGGGFPGLPLAILLPECNFILVDSIAKKIKVVNALVKTIGLKNVIAYQIRAEAVHDHFEFVISRAVTNFPNFYNWTKNLVGKNQFNDIPNGIISLKGGNLSQEISGFGKRIETKQICEWFSEEWFKEKSIIYLKISNR